MPDTLVQLYINIPVAFLNYKELIANNQPDVCLNMTEVENMTMFNYENLSDRLRQMLEEEHIFYETVSSIIMKLMQRNAKLTDSEKSIISTDRAFVHDYKAKV